jgi:hypothetical protein
MKTSKKIQHFFKDLKELRKSSKTHRVTFVISFVLLALLFALPIWRIVPLAESQPFLPLHYNIYFGVDRFGPWYQVFVLPVLGLVFLLSNLFFQTIFYKREKFLTLLFAYTTIVIEVVLLVAMALIVLLNISYAA